MYTNTTVPGVDLDLFLNEEEQQAKLTLHVSGKRQPEAYQIISQLKERIQAHCTATRVHRDSVLQVQQVVEDNRKTSAGDIKEKVRNLVTNLVHNADAAQAITQSLRPSPVTYLKDLTHAIEGKENPTDDDLHTS